MWPSYLYHGVRYTRRMTSLYWDDPQVPDQQKDVILPQEIPL